MNAPRTALLLALLIGCHDSNRSALGGAQELVFRNQPLGGDPRTFDALNAEFERAHPGVRVRVQPLPNDTDVAHQAFLTTLEGGGGDVDVLVADVVWVQEFARAGWIADLSETFPPSEIRRDFLPGPAEAVLFEGRTYAVPWYVDVGLLYYRTDLLVEPPRTYDQLRRSIAEVRRSRPDLAGYVWQGRQYEGLVCNVYEALWGHGGQSLADDRLLLDTPQMRSALTYLRTLITEGISPQSVLSSAEEESRRAFQTGKAIAMRNWPYAWEEAEREGSPIRGKVAVIPLPTESGEPGAGALGGYQLAMSAHTPPEKQAAAKALIAHLTSADATLRLAIAYGRNPPRLALYTDAKVPYLAQLRESVIRARPRPVTPYYNLLADTLQSAFSAAVAGVQPPSKALHEAQNRADQLTRSAEVQ